jgi:Virus neck protein
MATSKYFSNYQSKPEQRIIEDLIVESIKIMGFDAFYIPNDNEIARDLLYGEDPVKKFNAAFPVEMYLSSVMGHMGEKDFFSKFGLEIRNQVTVIVSKRSFAQRTPQNPQARPLEGDLVYVPFLNGGGEIYEIRFVEQNKDSFMLGRKAPYFYELELEKFKYSQEVISTGMPDIDQVVTDSAYTIHLNTGAGTGTYGIKELVFQSADSTYANATTVATVQSWIPHTNTLSVTNIAGEFIGNNIIIGASSNARFVLTTYDPLNSPAIKESYANSILETSGAPIINTAENNPIGGL